MKKNGNNLRSGEYYIGLDIGTNSVGWAVTDTEYNVERFKGNSMWGVRLFEEAADASERRTSRAARRRLDRRNRRILLLEMLFAQEISKIDPDFFIRLGESFLHKEDRSVDSSYSIFNDSGYNDKMYHRDYPTIYHLRSELLHSKEKHDVRLVFLALHHLMKKRGHFLYDIENYTDMRSVSECLDELNLYLQDEYGVSIEYKDKSKYSNILEKSDIGITQKKKLLKECIASQNAEEPAVNINVISDAFSGAMIKLADLFLDEELKNADIKSISLKNDLSEIEDNLSDILGSRAELISRLKDIYDIARLSQILKGEAYISDAKINLYNKNKKDIALLKKYVKTYCPEKYKDIFIVNKDKKDNYSAYMGSKLRSGAYTCNQENFCVFLKKELPDMKNTEEYQEIYSEIESKTFLSKLKGADNGVVPYQLNLKEVEKILENAVEYLPFLNEKDADGITIREKVISVFKFRVPYYVGPLNEKSSHFWAVRTNEKIYPWNFSKVVDIEKSAEKFIINLIGRCSYTADYVLPKDSLIYSEYTLRNELNMLRVNGKELPRNVMDEIYRDLFVLSAKKVTKKSLKEYLCCKNYIEQTDELSGIDITVKSKLKSYHDFKEILEKTKDAEMVEEIIKRILVFGEDKKMLKSWLTSNCKQLDKKDIDYVCRLKYTDWGRLSKEFLTGIYHIDENGEMFTIMDMLRKNNVNLMQLCSSEYMFLAEAEKRRIENTGCDDSIQKRIDEMYIAPAVRRSVRQALKIVDEIVDIKKSAPKKIFIEVARGGSEELKNKRTVSRKDKLIDLYKSCGKQSDELFEKLNNEEENNLRQDKLYLYYSQFGKCMYSEENIDLELLRNENSMYDIDHIFPRSKVKDDSLDNRVLVKSVLNREKTNIYPISSDIREKMYPFWKMLKDKNMISEKKFTRLTRQSELTEKELSEFVARQLVETQQSTKAVAALLGDLYKTTRLVYSKAANVSGFRQEFKFNKFRDLNDLHHAKDAYLNIVVGNVYDTKFTANFFKNIRNENYSLNKVFEYDVKGAWCKDGSSMATVKKYMSKNNILFTRMPYEAKGALYDLNILSAGKGQLPIKQGLDIEKYGGYNKLAGAYFAVVEHTVKSKRVRTLESILICDKTEYERNPKKYLEEKLNFSEPVVIVPVVRIDSLLELDGRRLHISGRTGYQIVYKHAYQFVTDEETEQYIKRLSKYITRCIAARTELKITEFDDITLEKNKELYEYYLGKLKNKVYYPLFKNIVTDMEANRSKFENMTLYSQAKLLLEILKAFKCDRRCPDFSELCGKKTVGILQYNYDISKLESAYMVNQSVTGLYSVKVDLLK